MIGIRTVSVPKFKSSAPCELLRQYRATSRKVTADPPKDGSAITLKAEAQRTRSKEFLTNTYSELCELRVSVVNLLSLVAAGLR